MSVIDAIPSIKLSRSGSRPRILALANQKGGVGKTTTAINLGTALAAIGERVLIIDLDPQGNASTGLGIEQSARKVSTYDVLADSAPLETAILETAVPGMAIDLRYGSGHDEPHFEQSPVPCVSG